MAIIGSANCFSPFPTNNANYSLLFKLSTKISFIYYN